MQGPPGAQSRLKQKTRRVKRNRRSRRPKPLAILPYFAHKKR